ncbi:MAG TPA: hypothetical protein VHW60_07845 [Caulobacteraceae bacterium]|nr:hypothetical protein [Caulobacteraceae bacterium]
MRIVGLAALIAGLAALTACGQGAAPAAGSNAPSSAPPTAASAAPADSGGLASTPGAYSCTNRDQGKVQWCLVFPATYRDGPVVGKRNCEVVPGSTFGATCPSDKLIGCCTETGAVGPTETCFYTGGAYANDPAKCAKDGGVWSSAP